MPNVNFNVFGGMVVQDPKIYEGVSKVTGKPSLFCIFVLKYDHPIRALVTTMMVKCTGIAAGIVARKEVRRFDQVLVLGYMRESVWKDRGITKRRLWMRGSRIWLLGGRSKNARGKVLVDTDWYERAKHLEKRFAEQERQNAALERRLGKTNPEDD